MIKEYKTIAEVAGPLMLVKNVENVGYDEMGEIELGAPAVFARFDKDYQFVGTIG